MNRRCFIALVVGVAVSLGCAVGTADQKAPPAPPKTPVIYCTDLFHPHDDPDDHFDIACLYAMPEVDLRAIILDQGAKQEKKPGRIPVGQLNHLTGRNVPCAIGLAEKLRDPLDKGLEEPARYQAGVELLLGELERAETPVVILTVGSMRDLAAAYNREPELFKKKVARIVAFIGDARGERLELEWNAGLDPAAYARIIGAEVPFYWVPCFDGHQKIEEQQNASLWQAMHRDLLAEATDPVMNFFLYALLRKTGDATAALEADVSADQKAELLAGKRYMWSAAVFPHAVGRKYVVREGQWMAVPPGGVRPTDQPAEIFRFVPVAVHVDKQGRESYNEDVPKSEVWRFQIVDKGTYDEAMTSVVRNLIKELSARTD